MFYVGLTLSIEMPKNRNYVTTRLVGWEKDAYIVTRYPYVNEKPINLKSKSNCIIRFVKDGTAYGFTAEVLSLQFHPAPLIFFKYPANIESMPFRGSKRFKSNISARLEILGVENAVCADATMIDISESGCCVSISSKDHIKFEIGSKCYLTFMIIDKSLEIDCLIRNFNEGKVNSIIGLEFTDLTPAGKEVISFFIDMLINLSK